MSRPGGSEAEDRIQGAAGEGSAAVRRFGCFPWRPRPGRYALMKSIFIPVPPIHLFYANRPAIKTNRLPSDGLGYNRFKASRSGFGRRRGSGPGRAKPTTTLGPGAGEGGGMAG